MCGGDEVLCHFDHLLLLVLVSLFCVLQFCVVDVQYIIVLSLQLAMENHRLRQELNDVKCQRSLLDDDRVLDSIEQSFQQFHAFLDMLRDAG